MKDEIIKGTGGFIAKTIGDAIGDKTKIGKTLIDAASSDPSAAAGSLLSDIVKEVVIPLATAEPLTATAVVCAAGVAAAIKYGEPENTSDYSIDDMTIYNTMHWD